MQKGDIIYINLNAEHMYVRLLEEPKETDNGIEVKYDKCWGLQMGPAMTPGGGMIIQKGVMDLSNELGIKEATLFLPKNQINIFAEMDKNSRMYTQLMSAATGISLPIAAAPNPGPNPGNGSPKIVLGGL